MKNKITWSDFHFIGREGPGEEKCMHLWLLSQVGYMLIYTLKQIFEAYLNPDWH